MPRACGACSARTPPNTKACHGAAVRVWDLASRFSWRRAWRYSCRQNSHGELRTPVGGTLHLEIVGSPANPFCLDLVSSTAQDIELTDLNRGEVVVAHKCDACFPASHRRAGALHRWCLVRVRIIAIVKAPGGTFALAENPLEAAARALRQQRVGVGEAIAGSKQVEFGRGQQRMQPRAPLNERLIPEIVPV
jgi:hypothetical protein